MSKEKENIFDQLLKTFDGLLVNSIDGKKVTLGGEEDVEGQIQTSRLKEYSR